MTSTYFCPAGISFCDEMYFTLTLGIGTPLCFSDCSETARFIVSETIAAHTSHYHTERHLLSAGNCFDDEGANGTGGVAGPPVDLTMMSGVEKPSKNTNPIPLTRIARLSGCFRQSRSANMRPFV
jgi:hypothetical protein